MISCISSWMYWGEQGGTKPKKQCSRPNTPWYPLNQLGINGKWGRAQILLLWYDLPPTQMTPVSGTYNWVCSHSYCLCLGVQYGEERAFYTLIGMPRGCLQVYYSSKGHISVTNIIKEEVQTKLLAAGSHCALCLGPPSLWVAFFTSETCYFQCPMTM